jgi:DNA modification methylase
MTGLDVATRTTWTDPGLTAAGIAVYQGDSLEVLAADENGYPFDLGYGTTYLIPDNSIDSVVTDPPYGLDFMGNEWDAPGKMLGALATGHEQRGAFAYGGTHSRGYADHDGLAFERWCEAWAVQAYRVLKPGGHLVAFGGSRTWHRLASGIEDAGFDIRDSIAWLYAQGFPKSRDVSQDLDRLDAAAERRARQLHFTAWMRTQGVTAKDLDTATGTTMGTHYLSDGEQPHVPTADMFDMMRPLLGEVPEDIEALVTERTVESQNYAARQVVGEHRTGITRGSAGAGGGGEGKARTDAHTAEARKWKGWGTALKPAFEPIVVARKPFKGTVAGNLVTYGTGAINIDGTRVASDDADAIRARARPNSAGQEHESPVMNGPLVKTVNVSDLGRFPPNVVLDKHEAAELDRQAPNAGAAAPASGPTLTGATDAGVAFGARLGTDKAPEFYGDKGGASRMFPTFRFESKAPTSERPVVDGVAHPTVKPLDLMQWLVRLVTPVGGTVLEPFAGSGTTVEACLREGFDCIAVEREAKYFPLIARRVQKDHTQSLFGDFDWEASA